MLGFQLVQNRQFRLSVYALMLAGTLAFAAGCGKTSAGDPAAAGAPQAMPVQVKVAQAENVPDTTEYLSVLKSRHAANISPQVEGYITKIYVQSGDHVTAGTPLLQIDPLKQQAAVSSQEGAKAAQEATVRYAQIQLDRSRKLFAAGVVPKQDVDNAQTTYDAAIAQLKALTDQVNQQQVELHYYRVTAPRDGIVGDIPVHVGDRVAVITPLAPPGEVGAAGGGNYFSSGRPRKFGIGR